MGIMDPFSQPTGNHYRSHQSDSVHLVGRLHAERCGQVIGGSGEGAGQDMEDGMTALELAIKFHETYERLAPSFGYETRRETRAFDPVTPNGKLMVAVCGELLPTLSVADLNKLRRLAVGWRASIAFVSCADELESVLNGQP
jgi:hypothetical protein